MRETVVKVERARDGRVFLVGADRGQTELVPSLASLHLAGNQVRLRTFSRFFTSVQRGDALSTAEPGAESPRFAVTSHQTSISVSFEASCYETISGLKSETVAGMAHGCSVVMYSGAPARAFIEFVAEPRDADENVPLLQVTVALEEEQFAALFRNLWFSATPVDVQVVLAVPCFRPRLRGNPHQLASWQIFVEADAPISSKLDEISIDKHLGDPQPSTAAPPTDDWYEDDDDNPIDPTEPSGRSTLLIRRSLILLLITALFFLLGTLLGR